MSANLVVFAVRTQTPSAPASELVFEQWQWFSTGAWSPNTGGVSEYFTIVWNTVEGLVAVIAGALAGSISLVGFGVDSFIEVISGGALLWRMSVDANLHSRERMEFVAVRTVGACFLLLASCVTYEAIRNLVSRQAPEHWIPGIVLACVSLVGMRLLSRAKRRVGAALHSAAMNADAKQTEFCTCLSAILLGGRC